MPLCHGRGCRSDDDPGGSKSPASADYVELRPGAMIHASQHGDRYIRVVVNLDLALVLVEAMQRAHVLLQRSFPRNRRRKKKRVQACVVKSLAKVTSSSQDHPWFIARNGSKRFS